jgi:hypothetical protein
LFNKLAGLCKKQAGDIPILNTWQITSTSSKEQIMKRIIDYTRTQDGALTVALIFLLAGCAFALLHAFGGAGGSINLNAPLFTPLIAPF